GRARLAWRWAAPCTSGWLRSGRLRLPGLTLRIPSSGRRQRPAKDRVQEGGSEGKALGDRRGDARVSSQLRVTSAPIWWRLRQSGGERVRESVREGALQRDAQAFGADARLSLDEDDVDEVLFAGA